MEKVLGKRDQNSPEREKEKQRTHAILKRPRVPFLEGCRSIESFTQLNKIDEGAYGVVFRAQDKISKEIVAIK